jgi:hypothetical protein
MAGDRLISITDDQKKEVAGNLDKMKKILDNKAALIATDVFTQSKIDEIQVVYDSTKKLYDALTK